MICARLVMPSAVMIGLSFQEYLLYLSTNGTIKSANMKSPGQATPVTNLSYMVRRNAYRPVRYHSGTVMPGGVLGSNFNPSPTGNTPPVSMIAPDIAMTIGTSNTKYLGMWTIMRPSNAIGSMNTWNV